MLKEYRVEVAPTGGTCFQYVEAENPDEATKVAKANPNKWKFDYWPNFKVIQL